MRDPLRQQQTVSEDALCGQYPFIQRGGHDHTPPLSTHPNLDNGLSQNPHHQSHSKQTRRFPAEIFEDLTKREIQHVVEILHYSSEATTGDDVHHILQLIQQAVACPKVIGGVAQLTATGVFKEFISMHNVSYSNDWLYTYCKNEYATVDPILKSLFSTFQTQTWKQTYSTVNSRRQLEFIEEARSFGLTNGITTGAFDREKGLGTFFSFAGGDAKGTVRYRGLLEYLIPYLHRVLIANTRAVLFTQAKDLSPREITVLGWMKEGKTNWEIAQIVGVTERTVRFHVESIFMKLDAHSRAQAVAVAMEHRLLSTK